MPTPSPNKTSKEIKKDLQDHLKTSAADFLRNTAGKDLSPHLEHRFSKVVLGKHIQEEASKASNPPPAPSSAIEKIMDVKQFLEGNYLEPGDVVLMTRLGSFFAWLLRVFDNSNFAHVAMVFQTPHHMVGLDETFLIETSMGGVEIVSLSQFLVPTHVYIDTGLPPDFVVGIKRLERDWARPHHRHLAATRMLHFIDNHEYNFRLLAALASPKTKNFYLKVRNSVNKKVPHINQYLTGQGDYVPGKFICSGFVQYAFVNMVMASVRKGMMTIEQADQILDDVIFSPDSSKSSTFEELLTCTPKYLAETKKLTWKYLIHAGEVFHVDSADQVDQFFAETLPKRSAEIAKKQGLSA